MRNKTSMRKALWLAFKIAIGSSAAIYLAELLHLQYASAAGGIALLTIMGTKWETLRLSLLRILTFIFTVCLMGTVLIIFNNEVIAYGIFVLCLVMVCELLGWRSAISVNAVIATHFVMEQDFTRENILNELMLVLLGITVAVIVNLFNNNLTCKKEQIKNMRRTEQELQMVLGGLAAYLSDKDMQINVWERTAALENDLNAYIREANEYQNNTFCSHPGYYIDYFEMRLKQCIVLHNLHYEMRKIRKMPKQAKVISEYILYMADFVVEINMPSKQIAKLDAIFADMKEQELPSSREEFESRAILYHILMGLEDFLNHKKKFVENMDTTQKKVYWNS